MSHAVSPKECYLDEGSQIRRSGKTTGSKIRRVRIAAAPSVRVGARTAAQPGFAEIEGNLEAKFAAQADESSTINDREAMTR